jgi:hypothetical protein
MESEKSDLIVPVYLNQRLVFDLVAMLEGGIATVTRVSEARCDIERTKGELTGVFGLGQALSSLLRVNLSGNVAHEAEGASEHTSASERVHTPASLFFTLRNLLTERKALHSYDPDKAPQPGEFVEFTASLRRNPLIEGPDSLLEILNSCMVFSDPPKSAQAKKGQLQAQQDPKRLHEQLKALAMSLKAGGTQDLVADVLPSGWRALLTVEEQFLNDPSLSDLVDGTFKVIGKVIRSVPGDSGSISLLRKTAMSRFPRDLLQTLTDVFAKLQQQHGFSMPAMEVEVRGPAFHILPLSIFT